MSGPELVSPEELSERVEKYLADSKVDSLPLTLTGLAIALGFASRQSLYDYEKREGYKFIIQRAKLIVEHGYEMQVAKGRGDGGIIFTLKNMGWSDKQELAHTSPDGSMKPTFVFNPVGSDEPTNTD